MASIKEHNKYIGITIGLNSDNESMWINGIKQNAIFLMNALEKAGHRVTLIDCNNKVEADKSGKIADDKLIWDSKKFPIHKINTELEKLDVLIMLGVTLRIPSVKKFKGTVGNPNKKVIKYMCGNNYVIDMERNLFNEKTEDALWKYDGWVDECWYVPQQGYQNHEYYRVLMNLDADKVKPVPFVWDPMFIDEVEKFYSQDAAVPVYQAKPSSEKQLCVMEPNMNVVKYSTIPLLIIEDAYVKYDIDFKTTNLISGTSLSKQKGWSSMMNNTSMIKNMIHCAGRVPVHTILANHADIVISHQWENPLNYSYLDAMYLQFPLIHNADMIKDAGYYYPDFNIGKGADQLKWVLENHDNNIDAYNAKNEEVLERYTVYNDDLISTYQILIGNLFKHDSTLKYDYDWKTNVYK